MALTYLLPGATWEPLHELRAAADAKPVALASFAVVTQTTGEDWDGAAIALSTQHTTDRLQVPELEALLVGSGRTVSRLVQRQSDSFQQAKQVYDQGNMLWNDLNNPDAEVQKAYRYNKSCQQDIQVRAQEVFQKLQQRGTTAHFQAQGVQTIRTDGRSVRLPIGVLSLEARHRIVAAPEVSLNAARTIDLSNTGSQPLLPGKVALYLEGNFLGTTEVDFTAQGESFAMFLGVVDSLKLSRELDRKRSTLERNGSRTRMQLSFLVSAENLSGQTVSLQLTDRIPVSEIVDVRIRNLKILPECLPDEKGLLHWDVALAGKEAKKFRIEYALEYPTELLQRAGKGGESGSPAPQSPLHKQIEELEKKF